MKNNLALIAAIIGAVLNVLLSYIVPMILPTTQGNGILNEIASMLEHHRNTLISSSLIVFIVVYLSVIIASHTVKEKLETSN